MPLRPPRLVLTAGITALLLAGGCAPRTAPLAPPPPASTAALAPAPVPDDAAAVLAAIRAEAAPDRRTARFDVAAARDGARLVLTGETDQPDARRLAVARLAALGYAVDDRVRALPDTVGLGAARWGVVTVSVANLRSEPGHAAELATQALLGTPLRLLKAERGWLLVQTPDRYLAWVDGGGIVRLPEAAVRALAAAPKVVVLSPFALAYSAPADGAAPVSDLVAGAVLEVRGEAPGHHRVAFPDGREAFVRQADARPYGAWLAGLRTDEAALVATARTLLGAPYLWGGTSSKGMDCSGFTKTVYLMGGVILPRDASQQALAGAPVDSTADWARLRPGDLLFFGRAATDSTAERVVHVGMWIGGGEFIHASGRVRVSSMDQAASHYEPSERARYLRTRRVLGTSAGVAFLREGGLYGLVARR